MADMSFRFLDLPPELRNWIYDFGLGASGMMIHDGTLRIPSLAQVCRQIRKELLPMYMARSNDIDTPVRAIVEDLEFSGLHRWLKAHPYVYPATAQDPKAMTCRRVDIDLRIRDVRSSHGLPYPSETRLITVTEANQRTRRSMLLQRNFESWLTACKEEIEQARDSTIGQPRYANWERNFSNAKTPYGTYECAIVGMLPYHFTVERTEPCGCDP